MKIKLNLLSEAKKNEIRRKKRYRLIVWQEIIIVSIAVFYVGILGSIAMMLSLQLQKLQSNNASQSQEQSFLEIDAAEKKFKDVNKKVSTLLALQQEHTTWSSLFLSLNKLIPEGVLLEKLSTTNQQVSFSGKATTRDILLQFQDKLNQSDCFQNAKIPLSDLFTQENVDFQLDVEIKKECLKPGNL